MNEEIIGIVEHVEFKNSGMKNGKTWKKYVVEISGQQFTAFGDTWEKMLGEEGTFEWKWSEYVDKMGVARRNKQLIEPFKATPRTMKATINESQTLKEIHEGVKEIVEYIRRKK